MTGQRCDFGRTGEIVRRPHLRHAVALSALFATQAIFAQSTSQSTASDTISQGMKFLEGVVGSILSPSIADFKRLVAEGRNDEAVALYEKNAKDFATNKELQPSIADLLKSERRRKGKDVDLAFATFAPAREKKLYLSDPLTFGRVQAQLVSARETYASAPFIREFISTDPLALMVDLERDRAAGEMTERMAEVLASFPHETASFGAVFPTMTVTSAHIQQATPALMTRLRGLDDSRAKSFLANTERTWRSDKALRSEIATTLISRANSDTGPMGRLRSSARLQEFGLERADSPDVPKLLVVDAGQKRDDGGFTFGQPHDGAIGSLSKVKDLLRVEDPRPTLVVYVDEYKSSRKILDKKDIESSFLAGQRTVHNAEYEGARMQCNKAQADAAVQKARNTLSPGTGWGAALQGLAQGLAQGIADKACQQFAATPPTRSEDVFTPYTYTVTDVQVTKVASGQILAIDRTQGVFEAYPFSVDEKKSHKVAYGRKESDSSGPQGVILDKELDAAALAPLRIDTMAAVLASAATSKRTLSASTTAVMLDDAERRLAATGTVSLHPQPFDTASAAATAANNRTSATAAGSTAAQPDARMQSVVIVLNPKGSLGAGFYVDRNFIVTNFHVIEGASTVELRAFEGELFTGRVVRKDIQLDLALIQVERLGPAVKFADGLLKAGEVVEAIGHPKGLPYSLTRGIVSAIRQMRGALAPGGDRALLIQTDTAINPGNSGGPLFVGDRVVGINTIKARSSEGIGFAVHYSEVIRFLSER